MQTKTTAPRRPFTTKLTQRMPAEQAQARPLAPSHRPPPPLHTSTYQLSRLTTTGTVRIETGPVPGRWRRPVAGTTPRLVAQRVCLVPAAAGSTAKCAIGKHTLPPHPPQKTMHPTSAVSYSCSPRPPHLQHRLVALLHRGRVDGSVGHRHEVRHQLPGRRLHGEVALVLAHHHHQHLQATRPQARSARLAQANPRDNNIHRNKHAIL